MLNFDLELNVILRGFKKNVDREKLGNTLVTSNITNTKKIENIEEQKMLK